LKLLPTVTQAHLWRIGLLKEGLQLVLRYFSLCRYSTNSQAGGLCYNQGEEFISFISFFDLWRY